MIVLILSTTNKLTSENFISKDGCVLEAKYTFDLENSLIVLILYNTIKLTCENIVSKDGCVFEISPIWSKYVHAERIFPI